MKKLKKAVLAVLSAVLVVGNINAVFADGDISVRMNGIVSNDVSYINFTDTKPIQIDNRTLTPARAMAEAAGMEVEWDQPTQTALLTLKADANSDRPIERFASEAINKIDGLGLDMTPTSITAANIQHIALITFFILFLLNINIFFINLFTNRSCIRHIDYFRNNFIGRINRTRYDKSNLIFVNSVLKQISFSHNLMLHFPSRE